MNPGLSGSHVSAFLPRREIGKQRTHWEAPEQNQRGALMGVSVLMHHAWREAKDVPFPFHAPKARMLGQGGLQNPLDPGPGPVPDASLVPITCLLGERWREEYGHKASWAEVR